MRLFCERRVDGLLIVPAGEDHAYLLPEVRSGTPVVFIDRPPGNLDADVVLLDNIGGARSAVEHFLAQGHRRIAFVGDEPGIFTVRERLRGYRDALAEAGVAADEALIRLGAHDADAAERLVAELLEPARASDRALRGEQPDHGRRPSRAGQERLLARPSSASTTSSSASCWPRRRRSSRTTRPTWDGGRPS